MNIAQHHIVHAEFRRNRMIETFNSGHSNNNLLVAPVVVAAVVVVEASWHPSARFIQMHPVALAHSLARRFEHS